MTWKENIVSLGRAGICHLVNNRNDKKAICGLKFGSATMILNERQIPPQEDQCPECVKIREDE